MNSLNGLLRRNNVWRYILYRLFNPRIEFSEEDMKPFELHRLEGKIFSKYTTDNFTSDINEQFNALAQTDEAEYLYYYNSPCTIEPYFGWVLNKENQALRRTFPYSIDTCTSLPHYIYYKKKREIQLEKAYALRYNWFNYYHFYNDIIGQLYMLEKLDFDKTIPLVVPQKILEIGYVRSFFTSAYTKEWTWFFQDADSYVKLNGVYLGRNFSNIKDQFLFARKIMGFQPSKKGSRHIFLMRDTGVGRNIINWFEIKKILEDYEFEIIDAAQLSLGEQSTIFSESSVISGIHGAGLTNMVYRYPNACKVLEIFPKNKYPIHYYWLARELGFDYDAISGETNENGSFVLSKEKLIQLLNRNLK